MSVFQRHLLSFARTGQQTISYYPVSSAAAHCHRKGRPPKPTLYSYSGDNPPSRKYDHASRPVSIRKCIQIYFKIIDDSLLTPHYAKVSHLLPHIPCRTCRTASQSENHLETPRFQLIDSPDVLFARHRYAILGMVNAFHTSREDGEAV